MPRPRLRRPLRLSPSGTFLFTERTVSLDVSDILPGPGTKTLHVGRGRGALEIRDPDSPPTAVDAVRVVAILEILDQRRRAAGEPPIETLFDPRVLVNLRRQGRELVRMRATTLPFEGRPRQCFDSKGAHPGEALWLATDTGETIVEIREPIFDDQGRELHVVSSRDVSADEAIEWLVEEGYRAIPAPLLALARRGRGGSR